MLADFRARGGRLISRHLGPIDQSASATSPEVTSDKNEDLKEHNNNNKRDCLDPFNHQKTSVLFSSFSYESNFAPGYCVNPW